MVLEEFWPHRSEYDYDELRRGIEAKKQKRKRPDRDARQGTKKIDGRKTVVDLAFDTPKANPKTKPNTEAKANDTTHR